MCVFTHMHDSPERAFPQAVRDRWRLARFAIWPGISSKQKPQALVGNRRRRRARTAAPAVKASAPNKTTTKPPRVLLVGERLGANTSLRSMVAIKSLEAQGQNPHMIPPSHACRFRSPRTSRHGCRASCCSTHCYALFGIACPLIAGVRT